MFMSGILGFGFYSGKIESSKNRIVFKLDMVRFRFKFSMFDSLRVASLWIGFELSRVISAVDHFNSC